MLGHARTPQLQAADSDPPVCAMQQTGVLWVERTYIDDLPALASAGIWACSLARAIICST